MNHKFTASAAVVTLGLALVSCLSESECVDCPSTDSGPDALTPASDLALAEFANCDEYRSYVADALFEQNTSAIYYYTGALAEDAATNDVAELGGDRGGVVPDDVSQTNLQETGVDEADVVKAAADGTFYVLNGRYLSRVDAFPPTAMTLQAALDLYDATSAYFAEMYLDESSQRLFLIGQRYEDAKNQAGAEAGSEIDTISPSYMSPVAKIVLAVVALDDNDLTLVNTIEIDGVYISSRRIDDRVHLVSSFAPQLDALFDDDFYALNEEYQSRLGQYRVDTPYDGKSRAELRTALRAEIDAALAAAPLSSLLPERRIDEAASQHVRCADVSRPGVTLAPGLLVVSSLDLGGENLAAVAVANNAWLTYASRENLYVLQTSQGWWWGEQQAAQTAIYRFEISEAAPVYRGLGVVPGWILNSFSLSENEGYLRVFTTEQVATGGVGIGQSDAVAVDSAEQPVASSSFATAQDDIATEPPTTKNHLFILKNAADELTMVSEIRDLAPGETVQSARFLGDRAFLVTFRQVDPLFAFDLSDPLKPALKGELKIPGFSSYMHPLGQDYLLTVGRDGDDDGLSGALAVQIFDVSDLGAPKLNDKFVIGGLPNGYAWSPAEYDHHAFTFYEPRGLLALPLMVYGETAEAFAGVVALRVDVDAGISELGRVDHADLAAQLYCTGEDPAAASDCDSGYFAWSAMPSRSVVMTSGDSTYLYSLSRVGIKATEANNADSVLGDLLLPQGDYGWWWY